MLTYTYITHYTPSHTHLHIYIYPTTLLWAGSNTKSIFKQSTVGLIQSLSS